MSQLQLLVLFLSCSENFRTSWCTDKK